LSLSQFGEIGCAFKAQEGCSPLAVKVDDVLEMAEQTEVCDREVLGSAASVPDAELATFHLGTRPGT
jgi:hypothetical protein